MLTFFLSFLKTHTLFWIPCRFGYICTKCVRAYRVMEIMMAAREFASVDEYVSSLSRSEFGVTLGLFAHFPWPRVGTKGAGGCNKKRTQCKWERESCAATRFAAQCWPEPAHAAVLNCTDNRLLHIRPSHQLLHDFRHTLLHWAEEWVWIEANTS